MLLRSPALAFVGSRFLRGKALLIAADICLVGPRGFVEVADRLVSFAIGIDAGRNELRFWIRANDPVAGLHRSVEHLGVEEIDRRVVERLVGDFRLWEL